MSKITEIIDRLPNLLLLKPADEKAISEAEQTLDIKFSNEYKEYLMTYGAILADGIELTGIAKSDYRNVVEVTKQNWELNSKVSKKLYVIEDTRVDGIVIWQDCEGGIYKTTPNLEPIKIFDNLVDYLESRLKN